MGDRHRGAIKGRGQSITQPDLADQGLFTQALGQPGLTVAGSVCFAQIVVGSSKGFVAGLEQLRQRVNLRRTVQLRGRGLCGRTQRVKVGPQRGADKSHTVQHHSFAFQPDQSQARASFAQAGVGFIKVQAVVFVIARHKNHRRGPAVVGRELAQAEIGIP